MTTNNCNENSIIDKISKRTLENYIEEIKRTYERRIYHCSRLLEEDKKDGINWHDYWIAKAHREICTQAYVDLSNILEYIQKNKNVFAE